MQFAGAPTAQQVAQALNVGGLPLAVAQDILTTGVQVIDRPSILVNAPHNGIAAGGTATDGPFDTSGIQSLIIELDFSTGHGVRLPTPGRWLQVVVTWSNGEPAGQGGLSQTFFMHLDDDGTVSSIRVPALGTTCTITYTNKVPAGTLTMHTTVIGSQRVCDRASVNQRVGTGAPWISNVSNEPSNLHLATDIAAPIALAVGVLAPLPPMAGELEVSLIPNIATTATQGIFTVLDHNSMRIGGYQFMPINTTARAAAIKWQVLQGWHPAYINCEVAPTGPTGVSLSAVWQQ